jgi:hypothetical protein
VVHPRGFNLTPHHRNLISTVLAGTVAFSSLALNAPQPAHAQKPSAESREKARTAFENGKKAIDAGDFHEAHRQFKTANELIPSPHALYWMAFSLDRAGKLDAARQAYEAFLNDANAGKAGADKVSAAEQRLAELKDPHRGRLVTLAPGEKGERIGQKPKRKIRESLDDAPEDASARPGDPAPDAEGELADETPAPDEQPAREESTPPEHQAEPRHEYEVGLFGGLLYISDLHALHRRGAEQVPYQQPTIPIGVRGGYFPMDHFGVEAEYEHAFGSVDNSAADSAAFNSLRGNLVAQYPLGPVTPFAVGGFGFYQVFSEPMGGDWDSVIIGGLGAKLKLGALFMVRLDGRINLMPHLRGHGRRSISPEVLLGLGAAF